MDAGAYDDVDAEGELDVLDGGGMTLVSAGGLETLGLAAPAATTLAAGAGVGKRYRPAPAKTFQCRGFGECRMVFSRSEHLARHVRKHTGERPFTCHCSKQFSRLDNLRQHAQTVHADKADLNEAMMRELTSLHASMSGTPSATTTTTATTSSSTTSSTTTAAGAGAGAGTASPTTPTSASGGAGKRGGAATKRARGGGSAAGVAAHGGGGGAAVKREPVELGLGLDLVRPRPGTSTGYEGAAGPGYVDESAPGYMDVDRDEQPPRPPQPSPPPSGGGARSFRGPAPFPPAYGQSFLAAHAYSNGGANGGGGGPNGGANRGAYNTHTHSGGSGQSFRGHPFARRSPPEHTPSPPIPSVNGNANGITPHRITSGGAFSNGSAFQSTGRPFSSGNNSFSPNTDGFPSSGAFPASTFPSNGGPPFSSCSGSRPSTGNGARLPPLSSVVSASAFRPSSGHGLPTAGGAGSILLPGSLTLRRPSTGGDWDWDAPWSARPGTAPGKLAAAAAAPVDDSPFSFHPPEQSSPFAFGGGGIGNPRKRAFGSTDGPHGAHPDDGSGGGGGYEYEYGSDSRPASRRLSVMELCNDDAGERRPASAVGVPLLRGGSAERERERERPTTTNGLVSRASALVLHDRDQQWEREHEPRQHASEQHVTADRGAGLVRVHGSRSRAGSVRGRDAAAPGGAVTLGARGVAGAGAGGRGDGGVPAATAGGAFLPPTAAGAAAGAGAAHRGGAVPPAADAPSAVPRLVRGASPPAGDGHGYGHGVDGGHGDVSRGAYGGHGGAGHGGAAGGRLSRSPPAAPLAAYRGGGLAGAGLPGGFGGVPPAPPRGGADGRLADGAVFARIPAYAAGVPVRGDDALGGLHRRRPSDGGVQRDAGLRYAPGGRAEVRDFAGAGHGPGAPGYEYEHAHAHRDGGGRGGGMRV